LEPIGGCAVLLRLRREVPMRGRQDEGYTLRPAPAVHVADPGFHVFEAMDGLQEGEIRRVDDGSLGPSYVRLDRGVQLGQLVRCKDVRRTAPFVNPQNESRAGWRLSARAHDGEEH